MCWMTAPAGAETSPTAHPQGLGKHGFPNTGDLSSPQATRTRRGTDRVPTPHSARARRPPRTASPSGSWSRGTALQSLLPLAVQGKDQHSPERCSADTRRPNPRGPTPRPHSLPDVSDVLVADRVQRAFVQPVRAEGPRGGRGGRFTFYRRLVVSHLFLGGRQLRAGRASGERTTGWTRTQSQGRRSDPHPCPRPRAGPAAGAGLQAWAVSGAAQPRGGGPGTGQACPWPSTQPTL